MYMVQEAIGCLLEDIEEKDYPAARHINEINLSEYAAGSFATLVMFDKEKYDSDTKKFWRGKNYETAIQTPKISRRRGARSR